MRAFRKIRGLSLLPVVVWLLTQLSMAGAMAAPAPGIAETGWADLGLEKVEICTSDGPVVVDPAPAKHGKTDGHAADSHCDWCQTFGSMAAPTVPATITITEFYAGTATYRLAVTRTILPVGAPSDFLSRAPPL